MAAKSIDTDTYGKVCERVYVDDDILRHLRKWIPGPSQTGATVELEFINLLGGSDGRISGPTMSLFS